MKETTDVMLTKIHEIEAEAIMTTEMVVTTCVLVAMVLIFFVFAALCDTIPFEDRRM